jgi:hypothetical protein
MSAFDQIQFEQKIIKMLGNKNKITCVYLKNKLSFFEMLHLIVFKGMFNNFEIINLDFKQEIEYINDSIQSILPYFEISRKINEK